jgi:hypothetical protein
MPELTERDLDALRRAMKWGVGFQAREPQLRVFPDVMPAEGTEEWIKLAMHLVHSAQVSSLGLMPWQVPPCDADDVAHGGWGGKPDEVELRQKMIRLGISVLEPDPPAAIAKAEAKRKRTA